MRFYFQTRVIRTVKTLYCYVHKKIMLHTYIYAVTAQTILK